MADIGPEIEVLETRLMRAWASGDAREMKSLVANDCIVMFGTTPPVLLDRPSLIAASESRLVCEQYRFGAMTARRHNRCAWFTGDVGLELRLSGREWRGRFLLGDLWAKSRVRRRWKLVERTLAPLDPEERQSATIRALQLWR